MATDITADVMLAALKKWGITPKFYRDDWRTFNRNAQQGWGPYYGHVVHNFGSDTSDANSLAYLRSGDLTRGMPGPLSQFSITDDGALWIIGWGAANHTGFMDRDLHALVYQDKAPLDADFRPNASGSTPSAGMGAVNPHYSAVEMCYGKAPTAAQLETNARLSAALMDACGTGYSGGSVVGHREATTQRSDPVGLPMWRHRLDVNARLKAGPPSPIVIKPPVVAPTPPTPAPPAPSKETFMALTDAEQSELLTRLRSLDKRVPPANALGRKAGDGSTPRALDSGDGYALANLVREQGKQIAALKQALDVVVAALVEKPADPPA